MCVIPRVRLHEWIVSILILISWHEKYQAVYFSKAVDVKLPEC